MHNLIHVVPWAFLAPGEDFRLYGCDINELGANKFRFIDFGNIHFQA